MPPADVEQSQRKLTNRLASSCGSQTLVNGHLVENTDRIYFPRERALVDIAKREPKFWPCLHAVFC